MANIDESTGVFRIGPKNSPQRIEKITSKNRIITVDGPRTCSEDESETRAYDSSVPVIEEVLSAYLAEGGNEQAVLAYERKLAERKNLEDKWLSFYNAGQGDGNFRFCILTPNKGLSSFMSAIYWGIMQRGIDSTKALTFVELYIVRKEKECRTPFWLAINRVVFDQDLKLFSFEGILRVRNDVFDYSDVYPWDIIVKGNLFKGDEEGQIQVVNYRDLRKRE